jgi:hypothetical protein
MAQKCKVCIHPRLKEINMQLIEGVIPASTIAKEHGLPNASMHYHKVHHLPKMLAKGFERKRNKMNGEIVKRAEEVEEIKIQDSFDLEGRLNFLLIETQDIYNEVRKKGQNQLALKALDGLRNQYQLIINLQAQINANKQLELEILKRKMELGMDDENQQHEQEIKIFNTEELQMLNRMRKKAKNQSNEILILNGKIMGWKKPLF